MTEAATEVGQRPGIVDSCLFHRRGKDRQGGEVATRSKGAATGSRAPTTTSPATGCSGPAPDPPPERRRWPTARPNRRVGPGQRPTTRGPVGASGANRLHKTGSHAPNDVLYSPVQLPQAQVELVDRA
jgi:hypothetical protein